MVCTSMFYLLNRDFKGGSSLIGGFDVLSGGFGIRGCGIEVVGFFFVGAIKGCFSSKNHGGRLSASVGFARAKSK